MGDMIFGGFKKKGYIITNDLAMSFFVITESKKIIVCVLNLFEPGRGIVNKIAVSLVIKPR